MTDYDLIIQKLHSENAKLREEKTELARRNRNLLAKNAKLSGKLQVALTDAVRYRRQVEALMDWDMG